MTQTDAGREQHARHGHRREIIAAVVVVLILLAAGGVIAWYVMYKSGSGSSQNPTTLSAADKEQLAGDTRSNSTKLASLTARSQADAGDIDAAAATLNGAIAQTGDTSEKIDLYGQLSSLYSNAKRRDESVKAINAAIALDPNDWTLYKRRGLIEESFGDIAAAKADYQKADNLLDKSSKYYTPYHNGLQNMIRQAGTN